MGDRVNVIIVTHMLRLRRPLRLAYGWYHVFFLFTCTHCGVPWGWGGNWNRLGLGLGLLHMLFFRLKGILLHYSKVLRTPVVHDRGGRGGGEMQHFHQHNFFLLM